MQILTPQDIKVAKASTLGETKRQIEAMAKEESSITHKLNTAKNEAEELKIKIQKETDEFVAEQAARRTILQQEVAALEARRSEALKPIEEKARAADAKLEEATKRMQEAEKIEKRVELKQEKHQDDLETLLDRKAELDDLSRSLDQRSEAVGRQEQATKISGERLAAAWVSYHAAIHEINAKHTTERRELDAERISLDARLAIIEKRAAELDILHKQLKDGRRTLNRAWAEFENRQITTTNL